MKKRYLKSILVVLLLFSFTLPASAASRQVKDTAGILTGQELTRLEERAAAISEEYDFGIYIRLLKDFKAESTYTNIEKYTIQTYDSEGLGRGTDHAGAMIVLSLAERDYDMDTNGDRADYAFTEAGRDWMEDRILPYFGRDDFYGGFSEYLDVCEEYLKAAHEGTPVGEGVSGSSDKAGFGIAVILGVAAAVVTGVVLCIPMHSAGKKYDANAYIVDGSMQLHRRSDMFLHRSVTRSPRQTQSSSGSSGSHHYSSGSHSGRSGKF